jgi:methylated-DNA-[protein]-cysteine S-methyltransferase
MKSIFYYNTDIGNIGIADNDAAITNLYFPEENIPKDFVVQETALLSEASSQLKSYLSGKRKDFTLSLAPDGTEFMLNVWDALKKIPYGETRSYKDIAVSINKPQASRAVGLANSRNPISIFIPCHRVIGANGKLHGYLGGLQIKKYLLELERKHGNL